MGKQIIIYKQEKLEPARRLPPWPGLSQPDPTMMSENSDEDQYTCRFCEKVLYSPRSLQMHEERHRETLKFSCIYCDKTFPTQTSLARHERTHTGEEEYPCAECDAGFSDKAALVNHTVKMHTVQIEQCDLTQSITVDRKAYMDSIKSSQNKHEPPPTQIRSFPISSKSDNYVSTTTKSEGSKEARFQCGYCDKSFATPSKVKRHILTHTGEKPFVCQFCQRGFSQKVHMMEHISKHHADESIKAQQDAAASAAAQAAVAQAQAPAPLIKTIAQQKAAVVPSYAAQALSQGTSLTQGSTLIRLPSNQTFTATQVSLADSTAVQITPIPENSYIVAEFSLKPENQPMSLSDQEQYDDEEGSDPEQDSTEIMATLPLAHGGYPGMPRSPFSQSPNFDGQQGNERPFVCPHCSADFIRQSNLSVHMMKVHGETVEVRTHQCSYCDKKFKYPNKRRLHEMTHTGEKPNVCQFCTMGFFKKSRLRVHLTKHHGIPEEEVNNPNSSYLASPAGTVVTAPASPVQHQLSQPGTQVILQKTMIQQIQQASNGDDMEEEGLFCQYCQKPFSTRQELLEHERQEAMEFEQLHEMFEDTEFTGLEVGHASQTDIIQNALLTAGIENGLGSPSVTDSDSVVTISEADIDSFSIGFIPDATWSSHEVVSSNLPPISSTSSDPFYPSAQPLDLNAKPSTDQSQTIESTSQDLSNISGTIYTTSETFQNIKTELPTSLPNEMWETTVALSSLPTNIVSSIASSIKTEDLTATSTTPINGIYRSDDLTFTLNGSSQPLGQDTMTTSIINLAPNQAAQIINGNELDFSKLSGVTTHTNFSLSAGQAFLDPEGLASTLQSIHPSSTTKIQSIAWQDDPTLPVGWKTRQHFRDGQANKVDIYYMSPDGTQFRSKWKVVEFMEAAGSYLQEEIEWVRASITTPRPEAIILLPKERTDKLKREWKDDDPTVPPGWKVAWTTTSDNRSKIAFMSPDKKIFHSRKAALQHMMAAGTYDPEHIVKMTKGLNVLLNVGDEWKEGDKSLPDGWKIRSHQWWCQKRNSHRIHYEFLSPQNEFFKSRKAVVEHMMQNGVYSEEQIETVRQQTTIITERTAKQRKGNGSAAGVVKDALPSNPLIGWKAGNSSLPPGWKIKRHEYANQTVYFYMSPKGDIIKSRRAVIDFMFEDGEYTEKDFNIVISGAKQRKVALQELYDAKIRRRARRKKRSRSDAMEEEEDEEDEEEETEEPKIDSDEELDPVEDDDKYEDAKKFQKKMKQGKVEPVLPTRRSGRIRIKEEKQKEEQDSEEEEDSDSESGGPATPAPTKRRLEDTDLEAEVPEPKRKRGRPPKAPSHSFELIELKGESEEEMIADTLLKVEQKMGDSLVKLDGNLFKVELSSQEDIKDFDLADASEIKMDSTLHNAIKDEYKFTTDPNIPSSIQCNQSQGDKVSVSQFYNVDGTADFTVQTKLVREDLYNSTSADSPDPPGASAYAVVVNVLKEIVSSISD